MSSLRSPTYERFRRDERPKRGMSPYLPPRKPLPTQSLVSQAPPSAETSLYEITDQPSPLRQLAMRAAAVVIEDFPAPPFPRCTERLAEHSPVAFIAVDCFCIVPMRAQPQRFTRAFEFRRHNQAGFERRMPLPWPDIEPKQSPFDGELGFGPLDLGQADIVELCAACNIDHSIPPVAHASGGSGAGYARWQRFLQSGLAAYARDRTDAAIEWPRGVSRLSSYIHHGQVSPLRIAREAWQRGGEGTEKFLDELLVWRELAFEGNEISWAARNGSKPGRSGNTWVIHAAPPWTRAHIDKPRERIAVGRPSPGGYSAIWPRSTGSDFDQ